ncbi:MAG: squalene--hopene cyclase, partial [Acidobacteria bacterium]
MAIDLKALDVTVANLSRRLLECRTSAGYWKGELSSSALSTATAISTLALSDLDGVRYDALIRGGLDWLIRTQNRDGGWGDTVLSLSNISTTALCLAAMELADDGTERCARAIRSTERWLTYETGSLEPGPLAAAVVRRYGNDRTFSAPILAVLALGGRLGRKGWRYVPQLPFELAALPQGWFRWLQLPVVSYALPALVAIGQLRHQRRPSLNPVSLALRRLTRER